MTNAATDRLSLFSPVAPGVWRLGIVFVNAYAVEAAGGWVLVDTGLPHLDGWVRRVAEGRFGKPKAIVLTHGHFDHAGAALALAEVWGIPVYAHTLELPYLTGRADYPPADPTPGGAICFMARFFPTAGMDLGVWIHPLPTDGTVPELPGWKWIHTPGHTCGHVSLFREVDRTLIAGDAFTTTDLDSWGSQMTWRKEFARSATPFTPDWEATASSVRRLADLEPFAVGAGHGRSMAGPKVAGALRAFARAKHAPQAGRYATQPAQYKPDGSVSAVPPPTPDPLPARLLLGAGLAFAGWGAFRALRSKSEAS